ncbi:MAG: hypothetical protein AB1689_29505, partial [Thermodesulfobacteriota bacterium]
MNSYATAAFDAGRPRPLRTSSWGRLLAPAAIAVAAVGVNLLQACSYTPPASLESPEDVYAIIDAAPYVNPTEQQRSVVMDTPGKLHVEHGRSCARANQAASETYIGMRITDNVLLPRGYTGTVYQNGYELQYEDDDHHVIGLGSAIYNVHQLGDILFWDAGGVISDHNGDDDYRWCYSYTVVAWPKPATGSPIAPLLPRVDIEAVHADKTAALIFTDVGSGAVHRIKGVYESPDRKPRGVLLAGFAASFTDDDHHLLQLGFDLGRPKLRGRKAKWRSDVVLKDNETRSFRSAELVSILKGDSVEVFHPSSVLVEGGNETKGVVSNDVRLKPAKAESFCAAVGNTFKRRQVAVVTPPYTWAMPMLTGWDLRESCNDQHKRRVGAWIESFSYVRDPGGARGTLRYTVASAFGDQSPEPFFDRLQVDVLGINLLAGTINVDPD